MTMNSTGMSDLVQIISEQVMARLGGAIQVQSEGCGAEPHFN